MMMYNRLATIYRMAATFFFSVSIGVLAFAFIPTQQDAGQQATIWASQTVTTTATTSVVKCDQGDGAIGRKTLAVHNASGGGVVTVTGELRTGSGEPNFTSGYLAVGALAAGSLGSDTALPTEAGGRWCQISAVSASTSTITATLRRE